MTALHELDQAREDLGTLLAEVLRAVFDEEPEILPGTLAGGFGTAPQPCDQRAEAAGATPSASALLAIGEETEETLLGVRVRMAGRLAHLLAVRMFGSGGADEPTSEDLLDAVGEVANIAGGNVKALLFTSARLSLPSAVLDAPALAARIGSDVETRVAPVTIRALVLGEVAELTLIPQMGGADLVWPPTLRPELLKGQP